MVIGDHTQAWATQVEAAGRRYADAEHLRQGVEQHRQETETMVADTAEQIVARSDRLMANGEVPVQAMLEVGMANPLDELATRERIIDITNQMQGVNFLARGVRAASSVARISLTKNGREIPQGTGSLISPRLLLTNNHVLPNVQTAQLAVVEFSAESDVENNPSTPTRYRLAPDQFFVTNAHLDFTVVLVAPDRDGRPPADVVGYWNRLVAEQGKIVVGESMNIIGHPMGRLKEISIRDNRLDLQLDDFLHYSTDTEPGNSGSPVFNDQWEMVALHHSGVPKTDDQGRALRRDGQLWQRGDDDDAVDWIANEGVRVSVILRYLAGLNLGPGPLDELGPAAQLQVAPNSAVEEVAVTAGGPIAREVVRGSTGSTTAFGGRRLVFLHGRGQENNDPEDLRRKWTDGLNRGLAAAGSGTVNAGDVYFPFYGDVLLAAPLGAREAAGAAPEGGELYEQMVIEAATKLGMPTEFEGVDLVPAEGLGGIGSDLLGKLQPHLSWIAARSGLDTLIIAKRFSDVASYLDNPQVRDRVLDAVLAAVPTSGRLVLVSHSLGTVVAVDLLSRLPAGVEVDLFLTAGSPLGLDAVYNKLLVRGPHRPQSIGHWVNAWYAGDPIAIGCPLSRAWKGQLQEISVNNPKDRAHDIAEYLAHAPVAQAIRERLGTP